MALVFQLNYCRRHILIWWCHSKNSKGVMEEIKIPHSFISCLEICEKMQVGTSQSWFHEMSADDRSQCNLGHGHTFANACKCLLHAEAMEHVRRKENTVLIVVLRGAGVNHTHVFADDCGWECIFGNVNLTHLWLGTYPLWTSTVCPLHRKKSGGLTTCQILSSHDVTWRCCMITCNNVVIELRAVDKVLITSFSLRNANPLI